MEGTTVTARMSRMENRLDSVEVKLDKVDKRLDTIENKMDKKFDSQDKQLENMSVMLVNHDHDIKEIKARLDSMDQTLKMFGKFQETLDTLVGYFKDNRQEVIMMEPRFKRLETRVDILEKNFQPA